MANIFYYHTPLWLIDRGCPEGCVEKHFEAAYELREKEGCDQLGLSAVDTHGKMKHAFHIFAIL